MENKLLNYSKTPIPVLVSNPLPNYEIMQSLLSKSSDLTALQPLSFSSSPSKTSKNNHINNHHHQLSSIHHTNMTTPTTTTTAANSMAMTSSANAKRLSLAKRQQEKSFIRNTINLINNHSSRTIAKDLVLSATRKHKAAHRAQRNLLISENAHLGILYNISYRTKSGQLFSLL